MKEKQTTDIYDAYITEALKNISENVAKGVGRDGAVYMSKSYIDILHPKPEPTETADDIIDRISNRLENL